MKSSSLRKFGSKIHRQFLSSQESSMTTHELFLRAKAFFCCDFLTICLGGTIILSKPTLNEGMSNYVLVYSHAIANTVISPSVIIQRQVCTSPNLLSRVCVKEGVWACHSHRTWELNSCIYSSTVKPCQLWHSLLIQKCF